jgi:hypothetical protein
MDFPQMIAGIFAMVGCNFGLQQANISGVDL